MAQPNIPPAEPAPAAIPEPPAHPQPQSGFEETDYAALADVGFEDEPTASPELGATEPAAVAPPQDQSPNVPASAAPPVQPQVAVPTPGALPPTPGQPPLSVQPPVAPQIPVPGEPPVPAPAAPRAPTPQEMATARTQLVEQIASTYKLSEDDKSDLLTDPDKVLPKLAGNLFVDVLEAASRVLMTQLPMQIHQYLGTQGAAMKARAEFFNEFPALNKPEYIPVLQQVTETYRKLNPQAPYDRARAEIARTAIAMLGLSAGTSPAPAPPSAPVRPATPLQPGAAASRPAIVQPRNIFEELATFELPDE